MSDLPNDPTPVADPPAMPQDAFATADADALRHECHRQQLRLASLEQEVANLSAHVDHQRDGISTLREELRSLLERVKDETTSRIDQVAQVRTEAAGALERALAILERLDHRSGKLPPTGGGV
jgi:uncharacterized coiled-coil protein SlyX